MASLIRRLRPGDTSPETLPAVQISAEAHDPAGLGLVDQETRSAVDMVEVDVLTAMDGLRREVEGARTLSVETENDLDGIHEAMDQLKQASADASRDISELASSTGQIAASADQIGRSMGEAQMQLDRAVQGAEQVGLLIDQLAEASREISSIVDTISEVARRTNLLALNATIEAARAGEFGRGFAVVASEVKALSQQTHASIEDIRGRVERLQSSAAESVTAVAGVVAEVRQAHPLLKMVAEAGHEQAQSTEELSRSAVQAASFVELVARRVMTVDMGALKARERSLAARASIDACADSAERLKRRFVPVIRQTQFGDRRGWDRYPAELPVRLRQGAQVHLTKTVDIGEGGVLIAAMEGMALKPGTPVQIEWTDGARIAAKVVGISQLGIHCRFEPASPEALAGFREAFAGVRESYRPLVERAQLFANEIAQAMEHTLATGRLTLDALFDVDYRLVPGTDPQQYVNRAVDVLEPILSPIQERLLAGDERLVFALTIDRNGYIGVHNKRYSQPQRPGDPVWNAANCRNRRIFDDRAGIMAARSMRPFLVQAYLRDMGGGQHVMMREVDAPLVIAGRHWGGVRMAYRF